MSATPPDTDGARRLAVRDLARINIWGDIHYRFTRSSTAIEGLRGHQRVQRRRPEGYVAEQAVTLTLEEGDYRIELQGRVDGLLQAGSTLMVEEIKTTRTRFEDLPPAVVDQHLTQLKLYAWMLCETTDVDDITLRLCYLNLDDESETLRDERTHPSTLRTFGQALFARYCDLLRRRDAWRTARNLAAEDLTFPFTTFRPGQRDLSVAVYRQVTAAAQLVMQAPTGIGKSLGTLFPTLKALPAIDDGQVFFLSARTQGQEAASQAMQLLQPNEKPFRSITLTAKDKTCFNPGMPCDPDYCEFAKGYYDRRDRGIEALVEQGGHFSRESVESVAREHQLCPFELSLDASEWCDVVICDYNYVFDPQVFLRRYFEVPGNHVLLLDESHNLVNRARDMYSAALLRSEMMGIRRTFAATQPEATRALSRAIRQFLALAKTQLPEGVARADLPELPDGFVRALTHFTERMEAILAATEVPEDLLTLYFDVLRFIKTLEFVDDNYRILLTREGRSFRLELFCVNPAARLAEVFGKVASTVCFSATMNPRTYFETMLGLDSNAEWFSLPSPFDPARLGVFVGTHINTRYAAREASREDLAMTIRDVVSCRPGNYLVFFPSYRYLKDVLVEYQAMGEIGDTCIQTPGMDDEARNAFLAELTETSRVTGFAVMGGAFSEAIDLVGERLVGCIIVGVGLPQPDERNEVIREHFGSAGDGYAFAYQFPGFTRVQQTAGRVIRTDSDRGIVCLLDDRYARPDYTAMSPSHWQPRQLATRESLVTAINAFWTEDQ